MSAPMTSPETTAIQDGLIDTAKRVLPGGTFGNLPGDVVIREGRGARVWDETGKEYVDFLLGSGPMLVGHAHPEVTAAAQARVAQGTTFFANNRWGIELAEAIVAAVPCAQQVRFVSTGSEADLYAMRAARGDGAGQADRGRLRQSPCAVACRGIAISACSPRRGGDYPGPAQRRRVHPEPPVAAPQDPGIAVERFA